MLAAVCTAVYLLPNNVWFLLNVESFDLLKKVRRSSGPQRNDPNSSHRKRCSPLSPDLSTAGVDTIFTALFFASRYVWLKGKHFLPVSMPLPRAGDSRASRVTASREKRASNSLTPWSLSSHLPLSVNFLRFFLYSPRGESLKKTEKSAHLSLHLK